MNHSSGQRRRSQIAFKQSSRNLYLGDRVRRSFDVSEEARVARELSEIDNRLAKIADYE
jgi:hypothetical protein